MTIDQSTNDMPTASTLISSALQERDRQMLQDIAHRLLAHGSLLRSRSSEKALYDWAVEHLPWLEEWAVLLGLKIILQRDDRLLMAVPLVPSMTRRLRRDETLVALALWYDFDVQVREEGAHEVYITVRDFNESFRSKFPSITPLSASRFKEILRGFARFNLIETDWTDDFSDSVIQVLPTLRFAIPFPDIEEWLKVANQFQEETEEPLTAESLQGEDVEAEEEPAAQEDSSEEEE